MNSDTPKIEATIRSLRVLNTIRDLGECTVTEIADQTNMTKPTVYNHLMTLLGEGFVIKENKKYRLGLALFDLGARAREQYDCYSSAVPTIDHIVEETGERVFLAVLEDNKGYIVYMNSGENAIPSDLRVGESFPIHASAAGKAILAFLPDEQRRAVLDNVELEAVTEFTTTDRDKLERELEEITGTWYAISESERVDGIHEIACPITDDERNVLGALGVIVPVYRQMDAETREEITNFLLEGKDVIGMKTAISGDRFQ